MVLQCMQVFRIVYCLPLRTCARREYEELCQAFVDSARDHCPELLRKVKVHLILHLVDCMVAFGPCAAYNTERYNNVYTMCRVDIATYIVHVVIQM